MGERNATALRSPVTPVTHPRAAGLATIASTPLTLGTAALACATPHATGRQKIGAMGFDANGCWMGNWCQDMTMGGCPEITMVSKRGAMEKKKAMERIASGYGSDYGF